MNPVIIFRPDDVQMEVSPGTSLLTAGRMARVNIRSRCNGNASCMMCKVRVEDQSGLSPVERKEEIKLGSANCKEGWRLACQAKAVGPVIVDLPEDPFKAAVRKQLEQQRQQQD